MFSDELLEQCQNIIDYKFKNIELLKKSLTHSSIRKETEFSNERLEFLGDAILELVTCEYLYNTLREFDEGDLTLIKSEVVSRETLAKIILQLGLQNYFAYSGGIGKTQNFPVSILANEFEAIVGAIYLDGGMESAKHFILTSLKAKIESVILDPYQKNYKSLLQFISQKHLGATPLYQSLPNKEMSGSFFFSSYVVIGNRQFLAGFGKNKKESEQEAAHVALQLLALEDPIIAEKLSTIIQPIQDESKNKLVLNPSLFCNSQSLLLYVVQKLNLPQPVYHHTKVIKENKEKCFFMHISIGGRMFPEVCASKYKEAEKLAARIALEILSEEQSEKQADLSFPVLFEVNKDHSMPLWNLFNA